jgi:hypothetical protein
MKKVEDENNYLKYEVDSYKLLKPYLTQFKELNPGSVVYYEVQDGKIESVFLCPNFMNESLLYVQPVMSLDATHLKSKHKGVMYLSTVKTGLNEYIQLHYPSNEEMKAMMDGNYSCRI